jgi:hypothetical protein
MNKKEKDWVMRILLGIISGLVLSMSVAAQQGEIPADMEVIIFEHSRLGPVTFLHKMHSKLDGVECETCHHTTQGGSEPEDCHNCHKPGKGQQGEAPKSIEAFHTRCRGCHQYTVDSGKHAGPVKKCTLCHIKSGKERKHQSHPE